MDCPVTVSDNLLMAEGRRSPSLEASAFPTHRLAPDEEEDMRTATLVFIQRQHESTIGGDTVLDCSPVYISGVKSTSSNSNNPLKLCACANLET